jgi:hypothetical protein
VIHTTCANCDAPLSGPYCAQCGQHAHDSARSLGALLHDGWHSVTHLDGRFWATLRLLMLRPGRLTVEYFAERRARYVPPVRLYIVFSVLMFATFSVTTTSTTTPSGPTPAARPGAVAPAAPAAAPDVGVKPAAAPKPAAAQVDASDADATEDLDFKFFDPNTSLKACKVTDTGWRWLDRSLHERCVRNGDHWVKDVLHAARANLPKMMFVFLPLMAAVMSLIYWFPRRYYVEHLVFFLHNHAALYLAMALPRVFSLLGGVVPLFTRVEPWIAGAVALYAPWYVYRSMRTVYGQGRMMTLTKIVVVSVAYCIALLATVVLTFAVSALTT